jgi:hypothetical protein
LIPTFKHTYEDQSSIILVKSEGIFTYVNHASEQPDSMPAKLPPAHLNRRNSGRVIEICSHPPYAAAAHTQT